MTAAQDDRGSLAKTADVIWRYARPYRARIAAAMLLLIAAKLAAVAVPMALKRIVDTLGRPEILTAVPVFLLLAYALLRFASTLFGELRDVVFARVTQHVVARCTLAIFEHLHSLSSRFHAGRHTGALSREVERSLAGIAFLLGVGLFTIIPTLVEIGAVLVVMETKYSTMFTWIILAAFLLYATFTLIYTERRTIFQRSLNAIDSRANQRLVDSLLNFEIVKYFSNENFEVRRMESLMGRSIELGLRNQNSLSLLHVGQSGIIALAVGAIMVLAGRAVVGRTMSVGDLVLINAYVIQICLPLNALGFVFRQARDALVNAETAVRLLAEKPDVVDAPGAAELLATRGEVRFEHVDFSYDPSRQILFDIDFAIASGATVAVVGGSGSGKSTLARLLFRLQDVDAGRITLDDEDIRGVTQESLRRAVGIVPQDTVLFNDTIAYNIGYGRTGSTQAEIEEAARAAHLHDFVAALPDGYATAVGERGMKLSGGERQRIAIARAILKNPRVLIFDEATSALDMKTERLIQQELERVSRDRTTLVIAHRLATVVGAAEILVMERGRIVERGTHQALLARDGLYAQMWQLQQQERALASTEQRVSLQPINLVAKIASLLDGLESAIAAKGIRVYTRLESRQSQITGDPGELQQALWDLFDLAIARTPEGGRLGITLEHEGANVELALSDTGAGEVVPAGAAESGGPAEERLRLAAVAAVLEQHGGRLEMRSQDVPPGTHFRVVLPLRALAAPKLPGGHASVPPQLAVALAGTAVLVVDDQAEARDLIAAALALFGATAKTVGSGREALGYLGGLQRRDWPACLVCDLAMPDEDGYTVIGRVRELEDERRIPLNERLPAIAVSGHATPEDRMHALLAGFQMHLAKPVDIDALVGAIAGLTRRKLPELPAPRREAR